MNSKHFRWSGRVWWACQGLRLGSHPYQQSSSERHADRCFPGDLRTSRAKLSSVTALLRQPDNGSSEAPNEGQLKPPPLPHRQPKPFAELTAREREVLELIAKSLNNAAIAQRLQLAPKTVRNLASGVFAKLQVDDRAQAMRRALDEGLGQ
jgi:DNA-binding NarL/FixJ family response regulator